MGGLNIRFAGFESSEGWMSVSKVFPICKLN